jgi:hypothetical protein
MKCGNELKLFHLDLAYLDKLCRVEVVKFKKGCIINETKLQLATLEMNNDVY